MRNPEPWLNRHGKPCKIGTVPSLVQVHGADFKRMKVGMWIRIRECENGKWASVLVTEIYPDGYFMADR